MILTPVLDNWACLSQNQRCPQYPLTEPFFFFGGGEGASIVLSVVTIKQRPLQNRESMQIKQQHSRIHFKWSPLWRGCLDEEIQCIDQRCAYVLHCRRFVWENLKRSFVGSRVCWCIAEGGPPNPKDTSHYQVLVFRFITQIDSHSHHIFVGGCRGVGVESD